MSRILEQTSYRHVLRHELVRRCQANPRYSQRAFARDLLLRPNRLSEVLAGKQGLSRAVAAQLAKRLGYTARERDHFCDLVDAQHARSAERRRLAAERVQAKAGGRRQQAAAELESDAFRIIADWHHMAIVELCTLGGGLPEEGAAKRCASALGIQEAVAAAALARLHKLKLLRRDDRAGGSRLVAVNDVDHVPGGAPSEAIRTFHAQVLAKAQAALATEPTDAREVITAFVGIRRDQLGEAKALIRRFAAEFCDTMQAAPGPPPDALYSLGVQFFTLSTPTLAKGSPS